MSTASECIHTLKASALYWTQVLNRYAPFFLESELEPSRRGDRTLVPVVLFSTDFNFSVETTEHYLYLLHRVPKRSEAPFIFVAAGNLTRNPCIFFNIEYMIYSYLTIYILHAPVFIYVEKADSVLS